MKDRDRLALIALLGHAPALWVFAGRRISGSMMLKNAAALLATFVAMAAGYLWRGGPAVLVAWIVGHLAWGMFLARHIPPDPHAAG